MLNDHVTKQAAGTDCGLSDEEIDALYEECREKLEELENDLMALSDGAVAASEEFVNEVFRALHSVKGAAGYLRHATLRNLSHAAENVLSEARDGRLELSAFSADVLLAAVDRMRTMVCGASADVDCREELERLNGLLHPAGKPASAISAPAGARSLQREPAPKSGKDSAHGWPIKILVVEDDFTSRVLLQGLLSRYGDCHIAVNGREAVEAFVAARQVGKSYDLICMDIRMPEMNGTEAVQEIRRIEESEHLHLSSSVRILMTTGIRDIKSISHSFKALCDAYLFKPIDGERLEEHLKAFGIIGRK